MRFTSQAGETLNARRTILDSEGGSLLPSVGYPRAVLKDGNDILSTAVCMPTGNDEYQASIPIPIYEGVEGKELVLLWLLRDDQGNSYSVEDTLYIEEDNPQDRQREPIITETDTDFVIEVPHSMVALSDISVSFFVGNTVHPGSAEIRATSVKAKPHSTEITISLPTPNGGNPMVANIQDPSNMIVRYTLGGRKHEFSSRVWVVNPSIMGNMQNLLTWLDKAKIANVLPSLRYDTPDLLNAMQNGLSRFNMIGTSLTNFNGTYMTSFLGEAWVDCSAWYLLTSQYLAEGAMAFDFSGQAVTLSVDRTQYLQDIIGRLEGLMADQFVKAKVLLAKSGINGGNGNLTGQTFKARMGHVGLTRHSLTQWRA